MKQYRSGNMVVNRWRLMERQRVNCTLRVNLVFRCCSNANYNEY